MTIIRVDHVLNEHIRSAYLEFRNRSARVFKRFLCPDVDDITPRSDQAKVGECPAEIKPDLDVITAEVL